jgi:anti-repressor protein
METEILEDDLFESEVKRAVEKRVKDELEKIAGNPLLVIEAYRKRLEQVEGEIKAVQPKVDFYDSVTMSDDWMTVSEAVKIPEWAGKPIGRNKMLAFLRNQSVLMNGCRKNEPYQKYVDLGYFRIVETKWENNNGEVFVGRKTVVSQKGLEFMIKLVNEAYDECT